MTASFQDLANFIWSVADLLRGPYRPPQYERVMLPLTVLRRFDCVLEATKPTVLNRVRELEARGTLPSDNLLNPLARGTDGEPLGFHNHSPLDFARLKGDPDNIGRHLTAYIEGFSRNVYEIFKHFEFDKEIEKLEEANRLYQVISRFAEIDLHPDRVDNLAMGLIFEDLIRRFNEAANETAGDHFTPREVIRLMVNLLLTPDTATLTTPGKVVTVCDPACGTGGMLSEAQNWIREHNEEAHVLVYGQDYNRRSYAVAASDLLIKGNPHGNIRLGDTLKDDMFPDMQFDYLLANPPFGVDWKAEQQAVTREHDEQAFKGRFGPKLPRVNDGALLFLLHMISKFEPVDRSTGKEGSRCAIVFNGSPLFTGGAASGESEIRRWIIENDWLETIIALPEQMFYNTGIGTFIWIVTNRKQPERAGAIQLIDARARWAPMRRSLGDKRRYLTEEIIAAITREHGDFRDSETSRVFTNQHFGYRRVTIERPLRLRFQITPTATEQFLESCPDFLSAMPSLTQELGTEPRDDWNAVWDVAEPLAKQAGARWTAANRRLFRQVFTTVDPSAVPVIARRGVPLALDRALFFPGQTLPPDLTAPALAALLGAYPNPDARAKTGATMSYEPDPALRDFENVPLVEDIPSYVLREVCPFVPDAWIDPTTLDEQDGGIGKVGYEINFNRVFFKYKPPRPLAEIDAELAESERRILALLREVTA